MSRTLRSSRRLAAVVALAVLSARAPASAQTFSYRPAGELVSGSGRGRADMTNYAPGMRFPIESAPAFANSQVWGRGGGSGPGGGQCDAPNYAYPWRDNYCETRSWDMPMCPSGAGHQGQDIRPSTCRDNYHWVVATAAGRVTNVGSYSVYITGDDGIRYDYLHMRSVQVAVGDRVTRGQRVGKVSNNFGGTPTTYHLHFNLHRSVTGFGSVYAPTYGALVDAYQRLIGSSPPMDGGVADAALSDARADVRSDVSTDARLDAGGLDARSDAALSDARADVRTDVNSDARGDALAADVNRTDVQRPDVVDVVDVVEEPDVEEPDVEEPVVEDVPPPRRDARAEAGVGGGSSPGCACAVDRGAAASRRGAREVWAALVAASVVSGLRARSRARRRALRRG